MRVAIVSSVESAREHWTSDVSDSYQVTIGINWACYHWCFDYVATWDALVWRHNGGNDVIWPAFGIVYSGKSLPDDVATVASSKGLRVESFPRMTDCTTTFPNALEWALRCFPAADIDIYGMDMDGRQGLAPWPDSRCHSSTRWDVEKRWIRHIMSDAKRQVKLIGCRVPAGEVLDSRCLRA